MSQTRIAVPNGMTEAAFNEFFNAASLNGITRNLTDAERLQFALKAALQWLVDKPILPTDLQARNIHMRLIEQQRRQPVLRDEMDSVKAVALEWQTMMFAAPEPVVPAEIKKLGDEICAGFTNDPRICNEIERGLAEAFQLSREAGCRG